MMIAETRQLNVLYVLNSPGGGATLGITELLKGLRGTQVRAYVVMPKRPSVEQQTVFENVTADFHVIPMSWWNRKNELCAWKRVATAASSGVRTSVGTRPIIEICRLIDQWNIDLVHTSTALILPGALAARICRKPHVWHIKEWIGQRGLFRFWLPDAMLVRVFEAFADRIVLMSRFAGSVFYEQDRIEKVRVIYDGVNLQEFDDKIGSGQPLRQKLGVGSNEILIAMVANLNGKMKRHALFIDIAARLAPQFPQVRFAIFGAEPRHKGKIHNEGVKYTAQLKQRVNRYRLGKQFIWAGFRADIPQMMDAIDILVHPCPVEGFGRIAIEAMSMRRPVVAPRNGGIAESVVHCETGYLVEQDNCDAFCQAVARLIDEPGLRHRMGGQGERRVRANFSMEGHLREMLSLYRDVLNNH